jgi:2-oxoglutarate dioxygenase / 2-oxoglutarate/L-arginine monooxygenase/decarboxylase
MRELRTFHLPHSVQGTATDAALGAQLIDAWRTDGIFQVSLRAAECETTRMAFEASRRFFRRPLAEKASCLSDLSYAGYVASGEEVTAGEADYSEIFTVCKDLPPEDRRVRERWPCHGPVPWPDAGYRDAMNAFTGQLGVIGDKLLRLVALAFGLPSLDTLTDLADDGWHHMRVLRFPAPLWNRFGGERIHYGTHFTNMFMRCYPERITTRRILNERRLEVLEGLRDADAA